MLLKSLRVFRKCSNALRQRDLTACAVQPYRILDLSAGGGHGHRPGGSPGHGRGHRLALVPLGPAQTWVRLYFFPCRTTHSWNGRDSLRLTAVSYTHLRAHETGRNLVCRLLLEKK